VAEAETEAEVVSAIEDVVVGVVSAIEDVVDEVVLEIGEVSEVEEDFQEVAVVEGDSEVADGTKLLINAFFLIKYQQIICTLSNMN